MKNARTLRTIRRAGMNPNLIGWTYLPTGKAVRKHAKMARAMSRLAAQLRPNENLNYFCRKGTTFRSQLKELTAYLKSEFREVAEA